MKNKLHETATVKTVRKASNDEHGQSNCFENWSDITNSTQETAYGSH